MLPTQPFRAARWLPDLYDPDNPGYTHVQNALPHQQGFYSMPGVVPNSPAVGGTPIEGVWGRDANSNPYAIVGANNGIYFRTTAGVWMHEAPAAVTNVTDWAFTQFRGRILAVAAGLTPLFTDLDDLMSYDVAMQPYFRVLPGTPPIARRVAVIRDFVVMGNLEDHPHRVHWSGFNNSELWTPDPVSQSGSQDLPGHAGVVQAIVPGERGLIFQETAIHRMTHVGPNLLFQFDEIERNRGTQAPNSVCWTGSRVFYYSPTGFFEYRLAGEESVAIGHNRVDRWVAQNVPDARSMRGVVDPTHKLVMWSIRVASTTYYDHILVYRWDIEAWSLIQLDHTLLSPFINPGATLDSAALDVFYGGDRTDFPTGSVDNPDVQVPFDSTQWSSGALALHVFSAPAADGAVTRGGFDGPPLPAVFQTGYRPVIQGGGRFHLNAVRPLLDRQGSAGIGRPRVTLHAKNDLSDVEPQGLTDANVNTNGRADFRTSGRYASFQLTTPPGLGFRGMSGFLVHARPKGGRGD